MAVVCAALRAADAGSLVRAALSDTGVRRSMRSAAEIDLVAVGKAARAMLTALVDSPERPPLRHIVGVSSQPQEASSAGTRWYCADHPVPDARSVTAARAVLEIAASERDRELLVLLLSGGASALMALPAAGISLRDKRQTSERLLQDGAEVHALNAVRKHLSAIKGGQLAAAAGGSVLTLAVSDVVGDDVSSIGSGPTAPDSSTFAEALEVLEEHGGRCAYPRAVVARLTDGAAGRIGETPKPGDPRLARSRSLVIGGLYTALAGARAAAESRGYLVHVIDEPVLGRARAAAPGLIEVALRAIRGRPGPHCVLAGGETTVRVSGTGTGGRNQECALAMADWIGALGPAAVAASVGTDGVDGPTDAAGGLVDSTTLTRAEVAGIGSPTQHLDDNNSYAFFDALGDVIRTGPTSTNVGDLQIIMVDQP
jgi:hydroxypyruvate reductase